MLHVFHALARQTFDARGIVEYLNGNPTAPVDVFKSLEDRHKVLLPVDAALSACRRFDLPAGGVSALRQGQTLNVPVELPGMVRIYAAGLGFLGLGEIEAAGFLKPLRLISSANRA